MATATMAGEGQLQRIIRDLHDAVAELTKEKENGEPVTDDSPNLHKFSYKLEYLLQFDQKEKASFLGTRKDYWDYFHDCLVKVKGANDGIRFVKSVPELKTSLGKGRAFIRYSLVHQRLADTLQQCLINKKVTSDWYYSRSPFLKPHLSMDIINYLYELNEVQFDLASRGHDLDSAWPTFARRTLGMTNSPSSMWKPPSRSTSVNSLASTYSQQPSEFPCSPDFGQGFLGDLAEPLSESALSTVDELRLELDQSEMKQRDLIEHVQELGGEAIELRGVVAELQRQLDIALAAQANHQELQHKLEALGQREWVLSQELDTLRGREGIKEAVHRELQEKLATAERKNEELRAKLDGVLEQKGERVASHFNSAVKIHELLDGLKEAEKGRMEALADGEERKRQAEQLTEELGMKEQALRNGEAKMVALMEKGEKLTKQTEDQRNVIDKIQAMLVVREKEANDLQKQLQDLQHSLEAMEKLTAEDKKRTSEERDELQKKISSVKGSLEGQLQSLKSQLKTKETEHLSNAKRIQHLEADAERLRGERQGLSRNMVQLETTIKDNAKQIEEYKEQCTKLTELKNNLLQTAKRNEETKKELVESKAAMECELAGLRASEKQLKGQLSDAKVTVNEREQRMREENRSLDEQLQKANMRDSKSEVVVSKLEQENRKLREEQATIQGALEAKQEELRGIMGQMADVEKSLGVAKCTEANLTLQLKERDSQLEDREKQCEELQGRVEELEAQQRELELGKVQAERAFEKQREMMESLEVQRRAVEKVQLESSACHAKEAQEMASKATLLEEQLGWNMQEVSRLQEEVVDLKAKLHSAVEEKVKVQARLDVSDASCAELRTLTEQLKKQAEELNRSHVSELLQSKECMEKVSSELDTLRSTGTKTMAQLSAAQKQVAVLKTQNQQIMLESAETREELHGANMEMAELGMTVCRLNMEREEASKCWTTEVTRIQELNEQGRRQIDLLNASVVALRQESASLQEELQQTQQLPETVLELKELLDKAEREKEVVREEVTAVRFQMSTENMAHQNQSLSEELEGLKTQLSTEREKTSSLQAKMAELEGVNSECSRLMEEKDSQITKAESLIHEGENEIQELRQSVISTEEALAVAQRERKELVEDLEKVQSDAQAREFKMAAEIEDLGCIKSILEERLIELIRDKDTLWQRSDALEYKQKLRAEEEWWLVDREASHCLGCQSQFSWWLRKHHCRLCGRIFCYYCSNHFVMTKCGSKKERCCWECYTQHSAVLERVPRAEQSSPTRTPALAAAHAQPGPPSPLPPSKGTPTGAYQHTPADHSQSPLCRPKVLTTGDAATDESLKQDDGVFDIITEEEVNGLYDLDSLAHTTAGMQEVDGEGQPARDLGTSGDQAPEEQEEMPMTALDAEINLLKSGELASSVQLHIDEIPQFGKGSRELFVKSSCYSAIAITVGDQGPTVCWVFSSEPKSISFCVVFRESVCTPVEQAKVLIPLTRCNAHKERIQGQLIAKNPGVYLLIFDNSFSRFLSKKVNYHLTIEKPVIYDGSDCL
ncbi:FYVE and coiled-coil domain-containing protein 1 isoform X3 [Electrophorus electricus]|uniref:FYVE and coiled-coil domain-containing protein 1 isoform X3 n=1 Tax=Electrophorus electricus TaxID=8005 RepID=UPI0015CFB225|nr:FYVE and coiled-coil domain-containing protein 1 isoform X3 [Electrophorus electricus]